MNLFESWMYCSLEELIDMDIDQCEYEEGQTDDRKDSITSSNSSPKPGPEHAE